MEPLEITGYTAGALAPLAFGAGRLAYAGLAKAIPLVYGAAALMLTTEAMICEIPEKKNSSPMPGGHDHGGGMDF
jgi:hypothetical protein